MADPDSPHKTVGAIMSRQVVTVAMDDSLAKAQELFNKFRFHHILVVEQNRLVGVLSDRDLLKAISPYVGTLSETDRDLATLQKRVHQIMSHTPITVKADTSIETAAQLLIDKKVSCLPIITNDGKVKGIVSWRDLLKDYFHLQTSSP